MRGRQRRPSRYHHEECFSIKRKAKNKRFRLRLRVVNIPPTPSHNSLEASAAGAFIEKSEARIMECNHRKKVRATCKRPEPRLFLGANCTLNLRPHSSSHYDSNPNENQKKASLSLSLPLFGTNDEKASPSFSLSANAQRRFSWVAFE